MTFKKREKKENKQTRTYVETEKEKNHNKIAGNGERLAVGRTDHRHKSYFRRIQILHIHGLRSVTFYVVYRNFRKPVDQVD